MAIVALTRLASAFPSRGESSFKDKPAKTAFGPLASSLTDAGRHGAPFACPPDEMKPTSMMQNANFRGSVLMALAMAGFALEDMFIKLAAETLPAGQVLLILALGGTLIFGIAAWFQGVALWSPLARNPGVIFRTVAEVVGSIGLITAIALTPLSSASAIMQATPLFITMIAALFMGEQVGWRRWTAIMVGFFGVLLVIRPGTDGFNMLSLFAVLGVFGLGLRDLATRIVPPEAPALLLSTYAFGALIPTGAAMMAFMGTPWVTPTPAAWGWMACANAVGVVAYVTIVTASRTGDVSVVAPFRYVRLVFALIVGVTVFGERPDLQTLIGAAIIVGSGLYTLVRQARRKQSAKASLTDTVGL